MPCEDRQKSGSGRAGRRGVWRRGQQGGVAVAEWAAINERLVEHEIEAGGRQ
jgi:hypothetical protein